MPSHPYLEHDGILAFAHRGDGEAAPENTMAAFKSAHEIGLSYFETDVHLTRDGVLLALHDDKLDRVTDSKGIVAELDYKAVREARVGGSEPIPLMSELFEEFPDTKFNIEPKSDDSVKPLIDLVKSTNAIDRCCFGSFSGKRIDSIREALPTACTSMGPLECLWARLGSYGIPTPKLQAHCAQVPTRQYGLPLADERFMRHLKSLGIQTHIWTVNEEDEMQRLLDAGVSGIMTDRPALLKQVLQQRGQWV